MPELPAFGLAVKCFNKVTRSSKARHSDVPQVLSDLEHEALALTGHIKGGENGGKIAIELDIDDGTDDGDHATLALLIGGSRRKAPLCKEMKRRRVHISNHRKIAFRIEDGPINEEMIPSINATDSCRPSPCRVIGQGIRRQVEPKELLPPIVTAAHYPPWAPTPSADDAHPGPRAFFI